MNVVKRSENVAIWVGKRCYMDRKTLLYGSENVAI